jgi:hypothetical protein
MWTVTKGTRIKAQWFVARPVALAGVQPKVGAVGATVSGVVRHIRASRPDAVQADALFIDADPGWSGPTVRPPGCVCAAEHVMVKPAWVVAVEPEGADGRPHPANVADA